MSASAKAAQGESTGRRPRRNRVTPWGDIVAVPDRGLLLGNRGVLHDTAGHLLRAWQVRRWIACRLEWRGRHRRIMAPNRYTELFFLDEATALAAGHRPCSECRHADLVRFRAALERADPGTALAVDPLDRRLHPERVGPGPASGSRAKRSAALRSGGGGPGAVPGETKRRHPARFEALADGCFVEREGAAWLVWGDCLARWSSAGYTARVARPERGAATLLTPPTIESAIRGGYRPAVHPTLDRLLAAG